MAQDQNRPAGKIPVIGFVKDPTGVAALCLGKMEGDNEVYMGKVGTGWSRTVSNKIRKELDTVVSPKSKLTKPIKKLMATWVEPSFMAEVEFRDITSEVCCAKAHSRASRSLPESAFASSAGGAKGPIRHRRCERRRSKWHALIALRLRRHHRKADLGLALPR
jgi:hypothetical protein